jgi:glutamate--cysteine ligase
LLYDETALDAAETLTADWTFEEVGEMRAAVPAQGIAAEFRGKPLREMARQVLEISRNGLKGRARTNREGFDETSFLSTLDEVVARGTTSAEEMVNAYQTRWGGSIEPVFLEYAY